MKSENKYKFIITMILTLSMILILSITLNNVQMRAAHIHNKIKMVDNFVGVHTQLSAR